MGLINKVTEYLYTPPAPKTFISDSIQCLALNGSSKVTVDLEKPMTTKVTPTIQRVSLPSLELCYATDAITFNYINKPTQAIMSAGYYLEGKESSVNFFEDFFDRIGSKGGDLEFHDLLEGFFKHQFIFGKAFCEKIPSARDPKRIVDLDLIDPKTIDYAKDQYHNIVLDQYGNSVGFVQTLPYSYSVSQSIVPPTNVLLEPQQKFVPPERIAQFKFYTMGDNFYPIGLIEPAYAEIIRKRNTSSAWNNSINRNGFPRLEVIFGDENHEPTEEMIQRGLEKIRNLDSMSVFAHPYYIKTQMVEAKAPEKLQGFLEYHTSEAVAASGQPNSLITGAGQNTNKSILNSQIAFAKMGLSENVNKTMDSFYKQIIKPIAEYEKIEPVRIVWNKLAMEELDAKASRLQNYVSAGLLTPDDVIEDLIRKSEGLPPRDKNVKRNPITKPEPKQK